MGSPRFSWKLLLEIRFPHEYFYLEPYFLQLFSMVPRGTIFYSELVTRKKRLSVDKRAIDRFPLVSLEITVRNKVPSENIRARTLFVEFISMGT
jgi:hypothetical protein